MKTVLVLKIILTINRQSLPFILNTNKPLPTASTELNCFFISLKPCQSALSVIEYQRSNAANSFGCCLANSLIALCEIITICTKLLIFQKMKIFFKKRNNFTLSIFPTPAYYIKPGLELNRLN